MSYTFDGATYDHDRDGQRLSEQYISVFNLMRDGVWRTLKAVADSVSAPQQSVSARLRDARKERFGEHVVNRRYVGDGLYEYQLQVNTGQPTKKKEEPVAEAMNPWHPITDPVDLKHLGKLGEETNELGTVVSRCIIQGLDGINPTDGKVNRQWLEEEIADVIANADLVRQRFDLNSDSITRRVNEKKARLRTWHAMA